MTAGKLAAAAVAALVLAMAAPVSAQPPEADRAIPDVEFERPAGPWRQLIDYTPMPSATPQADAPSGVSLWINESAILPEGEAPVRAPREAFALWIYHGTTRAGAAPSARIADSLIHSESPLGASGCGVGPGIGV